MTKRPEGRGAHLAITRRPADDHVFFRFEGAPDEVSTFNELELPWPPTRVTVVDSARPPLAPRAHRVRAVNPGRGQLVLRRSCVEPVLRDVPAEELVLRPVTLVDSKRRPLDDDFVYLDVRLMVPMDRESSDADWTVRGSPSGSFAKKVRSLAWSTARTPKPRIFRLGEARRCVVADAALVSALEKATAGAVGPLKPPFRDQAVEVFPGESSLDRLPKIDVSPKDALAAEEAFWSMYRAGPDESLRAVACKSPIHAFWVALLIDGRPADDTRMAASRHSFYAAMYVRYVDRGPNEVTERSAMTNLTGGAFYTCYVLRELTPRAEEGHRKAGWADDEIAKRRHRLDVLRAYYAAAPIPPKPSQLEPEPEAAEKLAPYPPRIRFAKADGKPSAAAHSPLSPEQQAELDDLIHQGRALVGVPDDAHASKVAQAVRDYVNDVQLGATPIARGKGPKVRAALAAAWCEALGDAMGWQWASLQVARGEPRVTALISPDRAYAAVPSAFIDGQTRRGLSSNSVMLVYNMLTGGDLPRRGKGKYTRVA
jgi:hypothetical protein